MKNDLLNETIFSNRRFTVTASDIRTRSVYYPTAETTGRVRKDLLWFALAIDGLLGWAFWLYFDLWTDTEKLAFVIVMIVALLIGTQISFLEVNAKGLAPRMFVTHSRTARKVFEAIIEARSRRADGRSRHFGEGEAGFDLQLGD
ncbi:MAG: hypothetical protein AAF830_13975 [Pseudomonadota bacterium]